MVRPVVSTGDDSSRQWPRGAEWASCDPLRPDRGEPRDSAARGVLGKCSLTSQRHESSIPDMFPCSLALCPDVFALAVQRPLGIGAAAFTASNKGSACRCGCACRLVSCSTSASPGPTVRGDRRSLTIYFQICARFAIFSRGIGAQYASLPSPVAALELRNFHGMATPQRLRS
jgi:hypothetical protein